MNIVLLKTVKRTKNVLVWQLQWLLGRYFSRRFGRSEMSESGFYKVLLCFVVLIKYLLSVVVCFSCGLW